MRQPINTPSRVPRYQNPRKVDGFCDFTVKSFPTIGKGFRIRFEAPYYEEGVGVDGAFQNLS